MLFYSHLCKLYTHQKSSNNNHNQNQLIGIKKVFQCFISQKPIKPKSQKSMFIKIIESSLKIEIP